MVRTIINIASAIIISIVFIAVVVLIITDKVNRAILAITGAIITYFVLIFIQGFNYGDIISLIVGTERDGYVNFHSLTLIVGMMFIVQISSEAGLFQFLGIVAVKVSKGKPTALMAIFCFLSVFFSAIVNNILTVMILIPLTITVSRILNLDPTPYIITEAITVNLGGTLFSISSIPNILIVTYASEYINFRSFFVNVGLFSLVTAGLTIGFFILLYKPSLIKPERELVNTLQDFNVWNVVQNRRLLYVSMSSLVVLMIAFLAIPPDIIPPDIIALSIAMFLTLFSSFNGLNPKEIMKEFDYELLFYLMGIFVIAGGLEASGLVGGIGNILQKLGAANPFFQVILILFVSAILSSLIDNIPITKVLIPIIGIMADAAPISNDKYFYSLAIGANWGDNLTPMGDNILVLNISAQQKRPINIKQFWKLGFTATTFQLILASIYFTIILKPLAGVIILGALIILVGIVFIFSKYGTTKIRTILNKTLNNFRNKVTG